MSRTTIVLVILGILLLICIYLFCKTAYDNHQLDQLVKESKQCDTVECLEKVYAKYGHSDIIEDAKKECAYCLDK